MATIRKVSLVDQVYEQLRGEIISLERPLGSKLNVNELQSRLNVSCTPIREALNRLQQEGLVVYENNIGAHVLELEAHDVEEIQLVALTLHATAIRLAMENGDRRALLAELERCMAEYRRARSAKEEVLSIYRFMGAFYHHCGNRRLDRSMLAIQGQQLLLRHMYARINRRGGEYDYYQAIFDAVRDENLPAAEQALLENGREMTEALVAHVNKEQKA